MHMNDEQKKKESRAELIDRWKWIAWSVFKAEDVLLPQWRERLREAKTLDAEGGSRVCDEYLQAIAEEIVSKSPDMYNEG